MASVVVASVALWASGGRILLEEAADLAGQGTAGRGRPGVAGPGTGGARAGARRGRELGQVRQRVDVDGVGSFLSLIPHVHPLLAGDQVDQLVAVLADNHGSKQFLLSSYFSVILIDL